MFFPSCKIKAAFPRESALLSAYLEKRWGIQTTACCRINRSKLTQQDTAVVVCHTCASILEESSAAGQVIYAWQLIAQDDSFPFPDYGGEAITLQDCYMARERREVQAAVRSLLKKMNFNIVELEVKGPEADFCGLRVQEPLEDNKRLAPKHYGAAGAFTPLPEAEQQKAWQQQVAKYKTARAVTYCGACRRAMLKGGAQAVHLLELLFPEK